MHLCLCLVTLVATIGQLEAVTLQTFAPCEDLSPHCPALCASCDTGNGHESESGSFEAPNVPGHHPRPSNHSDEDKPVGFAREKRFAKEHHSKWVQVPKGKRPQWLPSWIPWGKPPRHGGKHSHEHDGHPHTHIGGPNVPSEECGDLVNGGRQLIEAFCPKSCGHCGRSSSPLASAIVFIDAQCAIAKEPAVGLALHS